jgi:hypothetical protein
MDQRPAPDGVEGMAGEMGDRAAPDRLVELIDGRLEAVSTSVSPHDHPGKRLLGERGEDRLHDCAVEILGKVDEARAEPSVLGRWPVRHHW